MPQSGEEVTSEWVETVLSEGGHLPPGVGVASIDKKQIGIGRGFVGHTFLITAHYNSPTAPDMASKFVVKLPNTTVDWAAVFEPYLVEWFNHLYQTENTFFETMRDRCPIKLPKGYGSGGVLPEDQTAGIGKYWVMMEDMSGPAGVMEYEQVNGILNMDHAEQVVRLMATNHAAWWNKPVVGDAVCGLLECSSSTSWFNIVQKTLKLRWGTLKALINDPEQRDRWGDLPLEPEIEKAFDLFTTDDNILKVLSRPKAMTLCHGDSKIENFLWQKTADGIGELCMVDWQLLHQGNCAYDLCYFLAASFREVQLDECGERLLRAYYETLIASPTSNVTAAEYSYDTFIQDVKLEVWGSSFITINGLAPIVQVLEPMYEAIPDKTAQGAIDLKTLIDNGIDLLKKMWKRFHNFAVKYEAAPELLAFLQAN